MSTAELSDEVMHIFYALHFYDNFYTFFWTTTNPDLVVCHYVNMFRHAFRYCRRSRV